MNLARALTVTALAAGALSVSYLCILYFMQDALIYPGTRNRVDRVAPRPEGADLFHMSTTDANVEALFLPAAADANATRQAAVIFAHGNGEVIDYWVSALRGFQERGVGVLLVEYPVMLSVTHILRSATRGAPTGARLETYASLRWRRKSLTSG